LFGLPSQLANPAEQLGLQRPDAHAVVPCALVQASPHAPQFALVRSATSQPFAAFLSQSPKFEAQAIEQAPSTHAAAPLLLLQTLPQTLQLLTFVCVLTSHPLPALPSQLANPAAQAPRVHAPDVHDAEAFASAQAAPQAPQFERVVRGDSQPVAD
jgi:hypothetical protein